MSFLLLATIVIIVWGLVYAIGASSLGSPQKARATVVVVLLGVLFVVWRAWPLLSRR